MNNKIFYCFGLNSLQHVSENKVQVHIHHFQLAGSAKQIKKAKDKLYSIDKEILTTLDYGLSTLFNIK